MSSHYCVSLILNERLDVERSIFIIVFGMLTINFVVKEDLLVWEIELQFVLFFFLLGLHFLIVLFELWHFLN